MEHWRRCECGGEDGPECRCVLKRYGFLEARPGVVSGMRALDSVMGQFADTIDP